MVAREEEARSAFVQETSHQGAQTEGRKGLGTYAVGIRWLLAESHELGFILARNRGREARSAAGFRTRQGWAKSKASDGAGEWGSKYLAIAVVGRRTSAKAAVSGWLVMVMAKAKRGDGAV